MSDKTYIMIVEDNPELLKELVLAVKAKGYEVITAKNGRVAIDLMEQRKPDLILLDIDMPVLDGERTARIIRREYPPGDTAIIMMTGPRGDLEERLLELGVDDFVNKANMTPAKLLPRIRLRLPKPKTASKLVSRELEVDLVYRQAKLRNSALELTYPHIQVLSYLMQNVHKDVTVDEILDKVWPNVTGASENRVRVVITRIRKAIQDHADMLVTNRGEKSYCWIGDVAFLE